MILALIYFKLQKKNQSDYRYIFPNKAPPPKKKPPKSPKEQKNPKQQKKPSVISNTDAEVMSCN